MSKVLISFPISDSVYITIDLDHAHLYARQSVFHHYFPAFHEFSFALKTYKMSDDNTKFVVDNDQKVNLRTDPIQKIIVLNMVLSFNKTFSL